MNYFARTLVVCLCQLVPVLMAQAGEFHDDFAADTLDLERWQVDAKGDCTIDITAAPDGNPAARFQADNGARCEIVPRVFSGFLGDLKREPFGTDRWYSFRVFLGEPWKRSGGNEVLAQWHSTRDKFVGDTRGRGPPLALRVIDDYFRISFGWDKNFRSTKKSLARYTLWYGPVITGRWVEWTVRARWSYEDDGIMQIWRDGELIVDRDGPNTYNDLRGVYLKIGSYHPREPRSILFDDVRIGSEDPRAAGGTP